MDYLDSENFVDINSLKNWQESIKISYGTLNQVDHDPVFKFSAEINEKIGFWSGDIFKLQCEAIVLPINNLIDGKLSIESSTISKVAGIKYARSFVNSVIGCKTSEVRVTEGFDLPCHYIFHTVSPRYNPKYESAAINAIYNCYRNSLSTAIDKNVRKIGFSSLHLSKYEFPNDIAIHITARTIRRFLEKQSSFIDIIIFQIPDKLHSLYENIFPIYFPRNSEEENYSAANTPDELGNEDGQPSLPEREIRITAFPYGPDNKAIDSDDYIDEDLNYQTFGYISTLNRRELSKMHVAPAILRESLSLKHQTGSGESLKLYEENVTIERKFERFLRNSRKMNTSQLNDLRVFYQCGKDVQEQPILLVIEKNIPLDIDSRRNEIITFIIATLEKTLKGKRFSIIYAHTGSSFHPSRNFLNEVYQMLKFRYFNLLICMCMVHPNLYCRGSNWIFTTFNAPELKPKIISVRNLRQLYRILNPSLLDLPEFIYEHDKQVGGTNQYSKVVNQRNAESNIINPISSNPERLDPEL